MASDAFTNTTGTLLSAHSAGGITWGPLNAGEAQGEIDSNMAGGGSGFNVRTRATNLTGDYSQIVFKAGTYGNESKAIHVRAGAASTGYDIQVSEVTGDNITFIALRKNEAFLTGVAVSLSRLSDHTVAIRATTNGGNVELRGKIDGSPITWTDTAPGNETPGEVFVDSSTPITSGNPGFSYLFGDDFSQSSSRFDDFTDVEPSSPAVLSSPTPSGAIGTATTATIGATTDQATGNFYAVVDSGANLAGVTAAEIKAGQRAGGAAALASGDVSVGSTTPSVGVSGLVASTSYAYAAIQNNANGDSNIVTGTFTTASGGATSRPGSGSSRSRVATLMLS